ncbi:CU044_5270 family protein [Streptomyces sp. NBC_00687]|uniref:CU044_5270 family protein n=1 Tax=Streptomyces sp. NBC_00687 TaxID=2975807 RepID=UPI002257D060|nr:CU044_5270 family protein [Streptomyces sp. NBC_00687]MCX4912051.1 CU044_5270 family protein [Streptomyces sp. NBC_00687]
MKFTQSHQNPLAWEESAPLLPQTPRDLPTGRQQFHRERLMAHIEQSSTTTATVRPKARGLRLPRPAFVLPVIALAVAGTVVAGTALNGGDTRSGGVATGPALTTLVGATTTKGLPQLLDQASTAAGRETHPTLKPGQYVYIESRTANTFVKTVDNKSSLASYALHQRQIWLSADGTRGWLIDPTVNRNSRGETLSLPDEQGNTPKAGVGHPSYDFLARLTTDPDKLLKLIYKETKGQGNTPDQQAFTTIGDLLTESYPPAELYSALFRAAAKIPGVVMVNDAQDAIGRSGVAVARLDEVSGERTEWIFDKKTHIFLGDRTVQVKKVLEYGVAVKPGTVRYTSAITKRTIVDGMSQTPAHNG